VSDARRLLGSLLGDSGKPVPEQKQAARAIAWARVSTDMQAERALSIPEQFRQIHEYAQKHGIEIIAEYSEAASAFDRTAKRPEFQRMLREARANPGVSLILVHDYSRFSRDSIEGRALMRELREAGTAVTSVTDMPIDPDNQVSPYLEALTFAKDEAYSREVARRTIKGCKASIRARDPQIGWCYENGGQPP
jgi:site-specific DNA recombinase